MNNFSLFNGDQSFAWGQTPLTAPTDLPPWVTVVVFRLLVATGSIQSKYTIGCI